MSGSVAQSFCLLRGVIRIIVFDPDHSPTVSQRPRSPSPPAFRPGRVAVVQKQTKKSDPTCKPAPRR
jgi:hypothetical protein